MSKVICNSRAQSFIGVSMGILIILIFFLPEYSFAGTGGEELQGIYDKTVAIAQGYGGKTIAVLSFLGAMLGAIKGNLWGFVGPMGVSIIAGVGPNIVTSGISALI